MPHQSAAAASGTKKQKKSNVKAASPGEEDVANEKTSKTRTRIPSEKRKMQNRHNQRAFRQRREQHFKDMAAEDENLHQLVKDQKAEISHMKDVVLQLQKELADSRASPPQLASSPSAGNSYNSTNNTSPTGFPGYASFDAGHRAGLYGSSTDGYSVAPSMTSSSSIARQSANSASAPNWVDVNNANMMLQTMTQPTTLPASKGASAFPTFDNANSPFILWQQSLPSLANDHSHSDYLVPSYRAPGMYEPQFQPPGFSDFSKEDMFKLIGQPITPQAV